MKRRPIPTPDFVPDWGKAIAARMDQLHLTQADLVGLTGIGKQTISDIVTGKSKSTKKANLVKLSRALAMDEVEIMSGRLHSSNGSENPSAEGDRKGRFVELPLVTWRQAAHWPALVKTFVRSDAEVWMPFPAGASRSSFALTVNGPSMEPEVRDQDVVFVDPELEPRDGDLVVVVFPGSEEATLRQTFSDGGKRYLRACNPNWPNQIAELTPDIKIRGVVFFQGKNRR